ncbi:UNVERIFIED_CONTAM: hypothetical protein GTU68_061653 [Idotea baltica]|nr:hypothetical protein [Idotea baltica]
MKLDHGTKFANEDNIFKLEHVRKSDAGTYVCGYQANPANELTYVLDVQYPSTVVAKSPPEQRVNKGESATVECQAKGNPEPVITWSRESGHLPSGLKQEEGYSMTLENVDRHVEGVYTCTADNGVGEAVSASMKIVVEYPPEITTEKAIIRTGEGDVVDLSAIIHGPARRRGDVVQDDAPLNLTERDHGDGRRPPPHHHHHARHRGELRRLRVHRRQRHGGKQRYY